MPTKNYFFLFIIKQHFYLFAQILQSYPHKWFDFCSQPTSWEQILTANVSIAQLPARPPRIVEECAWLLGDFKLFLRNISIFKSIVGLMATVLGKVTKTHIHK